MAQLLAGALLTKPPVNLVLSVTLHPNPRVALVYSRLGTKVRPRGGVSFVLMDNRIKLICSEIDSDPGCSFRITDLTRAVNLSSSRLQHLFKSETGRTIPRYLKDARMEKARLLLDSTFLSIKEIMHRVGISSDSHFARDFREASGLSPTEYRARSRQVTLD